MEFPPPRKQRSNDQLLTFWINFIICWCNIRNLLPWGSSIHKSKMLRPLLFVLTLCWHARLAYVTYLMIPSSVSLLCFLSSFVLTTVSVCFSPRISSSENFENPNVHRAQVSVFGVEVLQIIPDEIKEQVNSFIYEPNTKVLTFLVISPLFLNLQFLVSVLLCKVEC